MKLVRVATRAVFLPLDALRVQALVLVGEVIAILADLASENDFFAGHTFYLRLQDFVDCGLRTNGIADC
jgi:hypothetical protein